MLLKVDFFFLLSVVIVVIVVFPVSPLVSLVSGCSLEAESV